MDIRTTVRQCGILLLVALVTFILLVAPAYLLSRWVGVQGLVLALGLCLVPGLLTIGLVGLIQDPATRVWLTVGGMIVRMLVVLLAALAIHYQLPQFGLMQFLIWLVIVYNIMLLTETWMLLPRSK